MATYLSLQFSQQPRTPAIHEDRDVQTRSDPIEVYLKVPSTLRSAIEQQLQLALVDLFERSPCQLPTIAYLGYPESLEQHIKLRRILRQFAPDR